MNVSSTAARQTVPVDSDAFGKTRDELKFWIECVGAPLLVVEKQTLVVCSANRSATTFFGLREEEFTDVPMSRLVGNEANQMLGQIWSNAPVGIPGEPFLVRGLIQDQERLLMVQVSKLIVEGEALRLFTFTDAPPQGSVALAGWQENIIAMLNWLPFGFEIASTDDQIQFANSQFNELFGYSQDEVESIEDWWRVAYPDPDYRQFARSQWETSIAIARAEDREMTPFDLEVATAGGGRRTIQFRHRTIGNFNVNLYLDVTKERAYAQDLKILAETDSLTGAMNRRGFFDEAARIFASGSSSTAILMLDIDHFKKINDTHGHAVGDHVLTEFTRRCHSALRPGDLFVRLGGEEFAVLLDRADLATAAEIAEDLRSEVSRLPFYVDNTPLDVTVSIGCVVRHADETSAEVTVSRADRALYEAKAAGRNRVVIHEA
jgi:diguanylate cyclase (GGDEF)-like protein